MENVKKSPKMRSGKFRPKMKFAQMYCHMAYIMPIGKGHLQVKDWSHPHTPCMGNGGIWRFVPWLTVYKCSPTGQKANYIAHVTMWAESTSDGPTFGVITIWLCVLGEELWAQTISDCPMTDRLLLRALGSEKGTLNAWSLSQMHSDN